MPKAIVVETLGPPEVMQVREVDPGPPGPGELRLRQSAVGINFADVHYRRGTAPPHSQSKLPMPFSPGLEGVGVVEAIGAGVDQFDIGDRVAYATASLTWGAYAEVRLFPAERAFELPKDISDVDAAALLYRAITVQGMIRQCYAVKPGDVILLHAAAGGVGTILSQWASWLGATVIGTVSARSKVERAKANGCAHVLVNAEEDFVEGALAITDGRGVDVCFDGVGADLFLRSFNAVRKYGSMVSFGQAAGMPEPLYIVELQHRGLYLTKFSGGTYNDDLVEYHERARDVISAIQAGVFQLGGHATYGIDQIIQAHHDLEERRTLGSLILTLA